MQATLDVPLDEFFARLALPSKAVLIKLAAEIVDVRSTNRPATVPRRLCDEPVVLRLIAVAKQPILVAGQHHQAFAAWQVLEEPAAQTWPIFNPGAVGPDSHVIVDHSNAFWSKAIAARLRYEVLRIALGTHRVAHRLPYCALPHQYRADGVKRQLILLGAVLLTLLVPAPAHNRPLSVPRILAGHRGEPAGTTGREWSRVRTRAPDTTGLLM
jgi:hypothetical protein